MTNDNGHLRLKMVMFHCHVSFRGRGGGVNDLNWLRIESADQPFQYMLSFDSRGAKRVFASRILL